MKSTSIIHRAILESLENRRLFSFGPEVSYVVSPNPGSLIAADFNGDGQTDLMTSSGTVDVLLGNANGTFQPALSSFLGPSIPTDRATPGDFNADGKLDLIMPGGLARGIGDGTFQPAQPLPLPTPVAPPGADYTFVQPIAIAPGDMNGDGKLDANVLAWVTFGFPTGDPDVPYWYQTSCYLQVLLGNGSGGFTAGSMRSLSGLLNGSLHVADFNGDSKLDLMIAQGGYAANRGVHILPGDGSAGLGLPIHTTAPAEGASVLHVGDIDNDGEPDVMLATSDGATVTLMKGQGNGSFTAHPQSTGMPTGSMAVGDVNGDAFPDLVSFSILQQNSGFDYDGYPIDPVSIHQTTVRPGRGDGSFDAAGPSVATATRPGEDRLDGAILRDFNNDNRLDLAAFDFLNARVAVSRNDGNWATKTWIGPASGGNWSTAANWSPSGVPTSTDFVSIDASSVNLAASSTVASLSLTGGASLNVGANGNRVLRASALTIGANSTLNLRDNDLILDYAPGGVSPIGVWNPGTTTTGAYDGVFAMLKSGRLHSSSATTSLTTLAVAEASDSRGITGGQTALFSGQTVDATTVLVKYTYAGDANLSGKVDVDDYAQIDFNTAGAGTRLGSFNGDFNLDGLVDVDDYGLIDFVFAIQGPPL